MYFVLCTLYAVAQSNTPAPVASFDSDKSVAGLTAPATITFRNLSTNAHSYFWDFGNGKSSTDATPTANYDVAGVFIITLTAIGNGGTNKFTRQLNVGQKVQVATLAPVASFDWDMSRTTIAPILISFKNKSINAHSYFWNFGNGETSTDVAPTAKYDKGGSFTITLTAIGNGGTNKFSLPIFVGERLTTVTIEKVIVNSMPFLNSKGASFDYSGGVDLYVQIASPEKVGLYNSGIANNLMPSSLPHSFNTDANVSNYVGKGFIVYLYDKDSPDSDDYVSGISLKIDQTYKLPYPKEIRGKTNDTEVIIYLSWSR